MLDNDLASAMQAVCMLQLLVRAPHVECVQAVVRCPTL
jgi:hypothetical protein